MKWRPIRVVALLAFALTAFSSMALAQADPGALYRQWLEAQNRGDVEAQLALLTDDAVLDSQGTPCTPCVGKDAIRRELERRAGASVADTIVDQQVSGNTATTRFENRGALAAAAGVERLIRITTVEVRGDRIAVVRGRLDTGDPQTARAVAFQQAQAAAQRAPAQLPRTGEAGTLLQLLVLALVLMVAGLALRRRGRPV
jgi:LPXTG-motif cell wall-anchored protein